MSLLILMACGQLITNSGTNVVITWTNAPQCSVVESSSDLKTWQPYLRLELFYSHNPTFNYLVPREGKAWFWRLKPCAP